MQQGYKQTEVGLIPKDWEIMTLADVCRKNGIVRGPFGGALKKEIFVSDGYKVYEQGNAIYRSITRGKYYIDSNKYNEMLRFAVNGGDFIVSCSGTIGMIYQIPNNAPKGIINQALLKLAVDKTIVDSNYFYLYFSWEDFNKRITDDTQGGAIKNLVSMELFKKTWLLLPALPEQERIAEALSDVDSMISLLEKLNAKKKAVKQGAKQELLTGKKRLPGFTGEWKKINLSKKSKIKARIGWQGLTTNEYLDSGYSYLVTGTDFVNGKIGWDNCHYVAKDRFDQDKNIQIQNDDILITKDGSLGKTALVKGLNKPATLNSGVFVIRPIQGAYDPAFVYYILSSFVFKDFLDHLSAGSTIIHLYQKDINKFEFAAPPTIEEQTAIASVLYDMDNEIEALEQKLAKARQIKQGMMQQLLTGKIRLT